MSWVAKKNVFISLVCAFILCNESERASAGHSSHGTDTLDPAADSAWFLGRDRKIKYCIKHSAKFGLDLTALKTKVDAAFSTWRIYMTRKLPLQRIDKKFAARRYSLKTKLVNCDGKQDLSFYFGVLNDELKNHKERYYDPAAFAYRASHDKRAGWSKGYIWISPPRKYEFNFAGFGKKTVNLNWQTKDHLQAILTHEIGHIYGIGHIAGTIMDSRILLRLFGKELFPRSCRKGSSYLTKIDDNKELVFCENCSSETWTGKFFSLLGHHSNQEGSKASLTRTNQYWQLNFKLKNKLRSIKFISTVAIPEVYHGHSNVFKIFFLGDKDQVILGSFGHLQKKTPMKAKFDGRNLRATLYRNHANFGTQISLSVEDASMSGNTSPVANTHFVADSSITKDKCYIPLNFVPPPFWY